MTQQTSSPAPVETAATEMSVEEKREQAMQTTAQVAMALSVLDSRYKENVAAYAQELHECTHRIDSANIELQQFYEQKKPYSDSLLSVEKEIDHEMRMLEHFTQKWIQKNIVISEFESELEHLSDAKEETDRILQNRKNELDALDREIGDLELTLLKHELERQNLLLKMEPIEQKIRAQKKLIEELEAKKRYIESAHLHRITQVASPQQAVKLPLTDGESV